MKQRFILAHQQARQRALQAVSDAPDGYAVSISEHQRSLDQNARLHAMLNDISRQATFNGRRLDIEGWKALLVSAHQVATGGRPDLVTGLEGELVQLRESTASMGKSRASSLIDYVQAWAAMNGIELQEDETV